MQTWIAIAQWIGIVALALLLMGAFVVAVLAWLLNHPK
jgi:hypothetical protein